MENWILAKPRDELFYIEHVLKKLEWDLIMLTGESAMQWAGWNYTSITEPHVLTTNPGLKGTDLCGVIKYCYVPEIPEPEFATWTIPQLPNFRMPDRERCIIDAISQDFKFQNEGYFYEMLYYYLIDDGPEGWRNIPRLKEVASVLNVPWDKVEYHLYIAENETTV